MLRGITKRYPGVVANHQVSLVVQPGEIHAVLGENGAGKSTLMKIIYGAVQPDEGDMTFNGQPVRLRNPHDARALGIGMVFQHFSLFDALTVAENVWLGLSKRWSLAEVSRQVAETARTYGLDVEPSRPVHSLSVGEMQRVEIVRALLANPQLLILDEPTSVLTPQAVEGLFGVLRQLAARGCSIVYISHKLHEVRALCTACTVLRGGRVAGVCRPQDETNASLSALMIGQPPPALVGRAANPGRVVLSVQGLGVPRSDPFGTDLSGIDLQVRQGEVVGIAGVSGNGQGELMRLLSGEDQRLPAGSLRWFGAHADVQGTDLAALGVTARRRLGLRTVPEERLGRGAVPGLGLAHNLLLTRREAVSGRWGRLRLGALRAQAQALMERHRVKAAGPEALARSLSGGNLQKFLVGREMDAQPTLLILSQPTWGVDVGAAAHIRQQVLALRDAGCAVLVVSEELDELLDLADRLHVMAKGRLSPSLPRAEATVALLGEWMAGLWPEGASATKPPNPEGVPHAAA